jgi:hypothetical protein
VIRHFVLPATAQRSIECDDGQQLIALRPGQIKFRREKLLLGFKDFVVTCFASDVPF